MKILFFHNTAPDYRIPFFLKMARKVNTKFIFTSMDTNKKMYGNDIDTRKMSELNYNILPSGCNSFKEIKNEIYDSDVDIVVIPPLDNITEIIKGAYIYKLCKCTKKKTLYFWEKWEAPIDKQPVRRRIEELGLKILVKPILRNVNLFLAPGKKTREYLIQLGVNKSRIIHIHDSSEVTVCDTYDIKEKYSIQSESKIILYYGRITKKKGLDNLLKAYAGTNSEYKNRTFIIVAGDGEFKSECEKIATDLNITNILFVGYVNPDNRYLYFSQCDIFVLPGRNHNGSVEAWGLTLNEALQFGKVLISTTSVGAAYELITSKNGFIVQEDNVSELTKALLRSDSEDLKISSVIECERIFSKYNYEKMSNDILGAVNKLRKEVIK